MKEPCKINAAHKHTSFASCKFENLALHARNELKLPQNFLGVCRSLRVVFRIHHELGITTNHRHWGLEIMHDLREQTTDCREPFRSFSGRIGTVKSNCGGYVGRQ